MTDFLDEVAQAVRKREKFLRAQEAEPQKDREAKETKRQKIAETLGLLPVVADAAKRQDIEMRYFGSLRGLWVLSRGWYINKYVSYSQREPEEDPWYNYDIEVKSPLWGIRAEVFDEQGSAFILKEVRDEASPHRLTPITGRYFYEGLETPSPRCELDTGDIDVFRHNITRFVVENHLELPLRTTLDT